MNNETRKAVLHIYEKIADEKRRNIDLWKSLKCIQDGPFGAMEEDIRILGWLRAEYPEVFDKEGAE